MVSTDEEEKFLMKRDSDLDCSRSQKSRLREMKNEGKNEGNGDAQNLSSPLSMIFLGYLIGLKADKNIIRLFVSATQNTKMSEKIRSVLKNKIRNLNEILKILQCPE
jgi:hypothetical protein